MPMLDVWFATIIIDWILNPHNRDMYRIAGINPEHFPREYASTRLFLEFRTLTETKGEPLARHELKSEIAATEQFLCDYSQIPLDDEALIQKHKIMMRVYNGMKLSERIKANPERLDEIVKEIDSESSREVTGHSLEEMGSVSIKQFIKKNISERMVVLRHFQKLSSMVGGLNPGRIGLFMGQTGFGKTNLLLNLALDARKTLKTIYINMEMTFEDISKRAAVILTGLSYKQLYNEPELLEPYGFAEKLFEYPNRLVITNGSPLSLSQIEAFTRLHSQDEKVRLLIIDYDQKIDLAISRHEPEWLAMKKAIERLEQFAIKENLHVILATQMNREGQIASSHRATFPAHYILNFYEHEAHGPCVEAIKSRHGITGQILKVNYDRPSSRVFELDLVTKDERETKVKKYELPLSPRNTGTMRGHEL